MTGADSKSDMLMYGRLLHIRANKTHGHGDGTLVLDVWRHAGKKLSVRTIGFSKSVWLSERWWNNRESNAAVAVHALGLFHKVVFIMAPHQIPESKHFRLAIPSWLASFAI